MGAKKKRGLGDHVYIQPVHGIDSRKQIWISSGKFVVYFLESEYDMLIFSAGLHCKKQAKGTMRHPGRSRSEEFHWPPVFAAGVTSQND